MNPPETPSCSMPIRNSWGWQAFGKTAIFGPTPIKRNGFVFSRANPVPGQMKGSRSGRDGRRQPGPLPTFPDKPPQAAPIRDPGAGAATAGGSLGIGVLALDPGSARFALVRESRTRSEEHTSELQSLMRISYAVFCLTHKTIHTQAIHTTD